MARTGDKRAKRTTSKAKAATAGDGTAKAGAESGAAQAGATRAAAPGAAADPGGKLIYDFHEGGAQMRALLGGKGAGLAEMTRAGLPVPPGFTITTAACNAYYASDRQLPPGLWDNVVEHMHELERETGKGFGDPANPLLVSVRSGAAMSMPGMMDTVPQPGAERGDGRRPDRADR